MDYDNKPKLTLADGSTLPCDFFGLSSRGTLFITVYGLSWIEAGRIFDEPAKTSKMSFPFSDGTVTRTGFTKFEGVDILEGGGVRVTMRRRYENEAEEVTPDDD
jgi:hypothetical protein